MKSIVNHWTAGGYKPNQCDLNHYHFIIDGNGKIYEGKFKPLDNENCTDGKYAAHVGGGNTGRIGVAICCRKDINTPPTQKQVEAMCKLNAELCLKHGFHPLKQIETHAGFGLRHPNTSSAGKIDINSLPYIGLRGIKEVEDYIQHKSYWYWLKLKGNK